MHKKTRFFLTLAMSIALINSVLGQRPSGATVIDWQGVQSFSASAETGTAVLGFEGATYALHKHRNPIYTASRSVAGKPARVQAELLDSQFAPLSAAEMEAVDVDQLSAQIEITAYAATTRGKTVAVAKFVPLRKNPQNGSVEKLVEFRLRINSSGNALTGQQRAARTTSSVLASGEWHKIGVSADGIYRLDYSYFEEIGLNPAAISPDQINIYGNGAGLLPMQNGLERPDDLEPNAIEFVGGNDGVFDPDDYILFFAKGPHRWSYDDQEEEYRHVKHHYTDTSFYFIGVDAGPPKRIATTGSSASPATHNVSAFDDYMFHELDQVNLIKSGRTWYGEIFDIQTSYAFSGDKYTFPNIDTDAMAKVRVDLMARTLGFSNASTFNISINGGAANEVVSISGITGNYQNSYARPKNTRIDFTPSTAAFNIEIDFSPFASTSIGWLNFISMNVRRNLVMNGNQMMFRDMESVGAGNIAEFTLTNANAVRRIWDVTDPTNATAIDYGPDASTLTFRRNSSVLREYIAFGNFSFPAPTYFGTVANQNLHALGVQQPIEMMIVTHPRFLAEANDLATFHTNHPGDPVYTEVATNQQVYNEFSSGMPDVTAIKDLMRMLYERADGNEEEMPKYLLLFGDGSYDNRSRAASNTNFILTYQSANSYNPLASYASDDYFGLLDPDEGESVNDKVDIAVGRITVTTRQEAQDVIKKIKNYMATEFSGEVAHCSGVGNSIFGEWRNRLLFVGDDEDANIHMNQANNLTAMLEENHPDYNITKVFLDAYPQESTPGGNRYPQATELIKDNVERGSLLVNYVGHGGEVGWAEERILDVSTIRNWSNFNALPLFVTATCEFTRFDDPGRTSAGEYVLLNPNGGGIALLSTTRLVNSGDNYTLAQQFYSVCFENEVVEDLRIGDICRETKVAIETGPNKRSFMLIGDPAIKLVYPQKQIFTTSITDTLGNALDTLKALSNVKVSGYVGENDGTLLEDFTGVVTVTVFDKASEITTLSNDGNNPFNFDTHRNVIYRGKAGVESGYFDFTFIVPKDINLAVDSTGRFSYYAVSEAVDAHGHAGNITVGSLDENAALDETGPRVELYMNDENFVLGGTTDENPIIFAKLRDESGINMVGTGIGHDLSAVLNDNTSQTIVLNDFYESDIDTYQSGTVRYQLEDMPEGTHKLRVKAWDVQNNSGEGYTEFVVAASEEFALNHVLNYPNPFTTHTEFSFEHNQVCTFLNVQIQIFTISGKLVKTINTVSQTNGFRVEPIAWNGLDEFGDQLARGVYVYKVKVRNPAGESVEKFEKLVILK